MFENLSWHSQAAVSTATHPGTLQPDFQPRASGGSFGLKINCLISLLYSWLPCSSDSRMASRSCFFIYSRTYPASHWSPDNFYLWSKHPELDPLLHSLNIHSIAPSSFRALNVLKYLRCNVALLHEILCLLTLCKFYGILCNKSWSLGFIHKEAVAEVLHH